MEANGLKRGANGLEVFVMCEIPNNVLLIDEFSDLFDGVSIGSNDLTQLTLGVDRDSSIVAESFDERDPGMLRMLEMAVKGAKRNKRHVGICGQAPSDHIEVTRFLLKLGIDSISLTPDRVLKTMIEVRNFKSNRNQVSFIYCAAVSLFICLELLTRCKNWRLSKKFDICTSFQWRHPPIRRLLERWLDFAF